MKALLIKGNRADVVTTAADAWKELLDTTVTGTASLMIGGKSYQVIYNNCFADYGKLRPTVLYNESTASTVINGNLYIQDEGHNEKSGLSGRPDPGG